MTQAGRKRVQTGSRPSRPSAAAASGRRKAAAGQHRSAAVGASGRSSASAAHSRPVRPSAGGRPRAVADPLPARGSHSAPAQRSGIVGAASAAIGAAGSLLGRSRPARVALIVLLAFLALALIDLGASWGRIYPGVTVGTVDLSGKTAPEAVEAIHAAYQERLDSHEALIFADDEAAASMDDLSSITQADDLAEQLSYEEAQQSKRFWTADALSLGAQLPAEDLAAEALAIGRGNGGFLARLGALFGGAHLPIRADYADEQLENLANGIDTVIGEPRVDFGMVVEGGTASVTEGHDGSMIDRGLLTRELDRILLEDEAEVGSFVAHAEYAPLRIDEAAAQRTCDAVNALITPEAHFSYEGRSLDVSTDELGRWVGSFVDEQPDGSYRLSPYVNQEIATAALVGTINREVHGSDVAVSFSVEGDQVTVIPHGEVAVPLLSDALTTFDEELFGPYRATGDWSTGAVAPVEIKASTCRDPLPLDEALSYGVVSEISSFTTQYASTSSTQNRNHNIHLASDMLSNTVAKANGGEWSFLSITGDCNAEAGFLDAGVIKDGKYDTADGGGVCQVATTVFNAVYDAGYPVNQRQAHMLHMASYPDGRDAAVAYPDLDLIWENDTDSDVLVRLSYTDTTVTATLYGIDPGYVVESEVGEWAEGDPYQTKYEEAEWLAEGTTKVDTVGTDGSYITVKRLVYDRDGNLLREATFVSNYAPINEVVLYGPGTNLDQARDEAAQRKQERAEQQAQAAEE